MKLLVIAVVVTAFALALRAATKAIEWDGPR